MRCRSPSDDDMAEAFAPDGTNDAFAVRILPGRPGSGLDLFDTRAVETLDEVVTVNAVVVAEQEPRYVEREDVDDLLRRPARKGFSFTLKYSMRLRSWARTMNTDTTRNVAMGTSKKSMEAISPRWLSKNVRQVCDGGGCGAEASSAIPWPRRQWTPAS
jgi:hypothetical protein